MCQSEAVAYAQFKKDHSELAYLGLNVVDRPAEAHVFVRKYGWDWPSIQDPHATGPERSEPRISLT